MAETLAFPSRRWVGLERRPLRVAFVNNMPDAAFDETFSQFHYLLGASTVPVDLVRYYLESVPRLRRIEGASLGYRPIHQLYANPPDALIVTGTEPKHPHLEDEPYWEDLAQLISWAVESVPSVLSSCLASHAALQLLDGLRREPLPQKLSGVYEQRVHVDHELATGLGTSVRFPHSRLNDIPVESAVLHGLRPVVASRETGWTVLTRATVAGLLVLFQGHPEYSPSTLLREYRRDVRRYFDGVLARHPDIPTGYLDATGIRLLERFRSRCETGESSGEDFPFDAAESHVAQDWANGSVALVHNWLTDARSRAARGQMVQVGGAHLA